MLLLVLVIAALLATQLSLALVLGAGIGAVVAMSVLLTGVGVLSSARLVGKYPRVRITGQLRRDAHRLAHRVRRDRVGAPSRKTVQPF